MSGIDSRSLSPNKILAISIVACVLLLALVANLFVNSSRVVGATHDSLKAALSVQTEIVEAHLRLEEILVGDKGELPERIWGNFSRAEEHINTFERALDGVGLAPESVARQVTEELSKARDLLAQARFSAELRLTVIDSHAGTEFDAKFEMVLDELF